MQVPDFDLKEMLDAGCHFGHQSKKWHPSMAPWIHMEQDGIHIFDLLKTKAQMEKAYEFAYNLGKQGKTLLFVATKRQAKEVAKKAATEAGALYVISRWLGGTLSNWEQINRSLKRMLDTEDGLKKGRFDAYTKLERVKLDKKVARLARFFEGLRELKKRPDALFIIDPRREKNALAEARLEKIPVLALVDSNADVRDIDLPLPANDDVPASIELIVKAVASGYKDGKNSK